MEHTMIRSVLATSLLVMAIASPAAGQGATATPAQPVIPEPPAEIEVGRVAPDFTLAWADSAGTRATPVTLSSLRGQVVVLAFYPADRSSGCTHELTKFRDEYQQLFGSGTVVVPISVDSIESHASWAKEMSFPFALASDPGGDIAKKYGSWAPGRKYSTRTVFVLGKDGRILYRNLRFLALNENAYTELAAEVAKAQQGLQQTR
jgi:peroxiredoxin Q/BCP